MKKNNKIIAYKGFTPELTCIDFQYQVGKSYELPFGETPKLCSNGFHACEYPLSVFNYYGPTNCNGVPNRFCQVELSGDISTRDHLGDKMASSKIRILREVNLRELIQQSVQFILRNLRRKYSSPGISSKYDHSKITCNKDSSIAFNDNWWSYSKCEGHSSVAVSAGAFSLAECMTPNSVAIATDEFSVSIGNEHNSVAICTSVASGADNKGTSSIAAVTDGCSVATNIGNYSIAASTGDLSVAVNKGLRSVALITDMCSTAINEGKRSIAIGSNHNSFVKAVGDYSVAIATGQFSQSYVNGKGSVAIATDRHCLVKGAIGCALFLVEREHNEDDMSPIKHVKAVIVDGETVKADTWYTLLNGQLIESNYD